MFRILLVCPDDKREVGEGWSDRTHFSIFGEIYLERFGVILETQGSHGEEDIFAIHRLSLLLLAFFRSCKNDNTSERFPRRFLAGFFSDLPSLVMKEINSLTHSCMHSFASLAILAFSGRAVFIIRATGAKLRMLASEAAAPYSLSLDRCWPEGDDGEWSEDMVNAICREDFGPTRVKAGCKSSLKGKGCDE